MRILLVDDDTGVIQALLAILKSVPGYEIRVATNGERALEHAATLGGVDLLIADVVMEPMDGFTLRGHVLAQCPGAHTIFLSGYDLSEYAEQTKGYQVLSKPVDADTLLAAIENEFAGEPEPEPEEAPAPNVVSRPIGVPQAQTRSSGLLRPPVARPVAVPQAGVPRTAPAGRDSGVQPSGRAIAFGQPEPASLETEAEPEPQPEAAAEEELNGQAYEPAPETSEAEAAEADELVGQTLGAYRIHRRLGTGRWGSVYEAVQTAINRPVALKVLNSAQAEDPGTRARFIADARAKAGVQHPAILAVYEAGEAAGHIFYAHEYVEGWNLAQIKEAGRQLDEPAALKVLRAAAEGLAYLTVQRIPHTAPQPGSVYFGTDGGGRLANMATETSEEQLPVPGEIKALGRILLGVLPPLQMLKPGLRELLKRMVQQGPQSITNWGTLLQGIQAIEPKVVPLEAARISAQDRAALAAVAELRKRKKRALIINLSSFLCLLGIIAFLSWKFLMGKKEQLFDDQVYIPAGEFLFGPNAQPVTLPEFWIDKYEVTYGQYAKFVEYLDSHPTTEFDHPDQPPGKSHKPEGWDIYYKRAVLNLPVHGSIPIDLSSPVMQINWWDAYAFAKWKGRELPTEQEWEKAARGTKGFIYPWGDDPDPKKANSNADYHNGDKAAIGEVDGFVFWNGVDKIKSDRSPLGVVGMAGNVAEWVGTWDPVKKQPVVKGGSYMSSDVRLDRRSELDPNSTSESRGFRTVTHTDPAKRK